MKFIKKFSLSLLSFLVYLLSYAPSAHAQGTWGGNCVQGDVAKIQGLECLFGNVLQIIVGIAGLAFLMMFVKGGFDYLMSSNDDKKVAAASSTLTSAVIGLIGVIISWLILKFIADFTGVKDILEFKIPTR